MISQKTRSSLVVTIGTILVAVGTFLLVAFASGYNLDILSGEIYTTGLALLKTNPSGANITINDQDSNLKTPHRLENIKTGPLSIGYHKNGYHPWKTDFFVRAGEVTFADYALLIPDKIAPKEVETNNNLVHLFNSQDNTKVFAISNSPLSLFEIREDTTFRKIIELPVNSSFQLPQSADVLSINNDGTAMILRVHYESGNKILWLNTTNGELIDLDSIASIVNPMISLRNSREVYYLNNGNIHKINTTDKSITPLSLGGVTSYSIDSDHIYTLENLAPSENGQFFVQYDLNGNNRYVLSQFLHTPTPWTIQTSRLNGQNNFALTDPTTNTLHIIRRLDGKTLTSDLGINTKNTKFSPNGRFISFTQNNELRTIDLEFTDRFRVSSEEIYSIKWLTDFQMTLSKPDGPYIVDFTGQNLIKIPPTINLNDGLLTAIDSDSKRIYYSFNAKLYTYNLGTSESLINFR